MNCQSSTHQQQERKKRSKFLRGQFYKKNEYAASDCSKLRPLKPYQCVMIFIDCALWESELVKSVCAGKKLMILI